MGGRTIEALLTAGTLTTTYAAVNDAGDKQVLRVLHPELSESMAERFAELLAQAPDVAPEDTARAATVMERCSATPGAEAADAAARARHNPTSSHRSRLP